jgi:hypothetical protein
MVNKNLVMVVAACAALWAAGAAQAAIIFDFENIAQHSTFPVNITVTALTADFSGNYFIGQPSDVGVIPAGFTGNCIEPRSVFASDLVVSFSSPLTDFSILYAPQELNCDTSCTMRVTAYMNTTFVGTATHSTPNPDAISWPPGTLSYSNAAQPFNNVVVHWEAPPTSGSDYGPIFIADNMTVTVAPEPGTLGVFTLAPFLLLHRRQRCVPA